MGRSGDCSFGCKPSRIRAGNRSSHSCRPATRAIPTSTGAKPPAPRGTAQVAVQCERPATILHGVLVRSAQQCCVSFATYRLQRHAPDTGQSWLGGLGGRRKTGSSGAKSRNYPPFAIYNQLRSTGIITLEFTENSLGVERRASIGEIWLLNTALRTPANAEA